VDPNKGKQMIAEGKRKKGERSGREMSPNQPHGAESLLHSCSRIATSSSVNHLRPHRTRRG